MFNSIKKVSLVSIFVGFSCFFGVTVESSVTSNTPIMTIFVHGIIKPPWTIRDLFFIAHNNIECTRYKFAAEYLRRSHEYFLTQPVQSLGLKKIEINSDYTTCAAAAIASIYKQTDGPENLYYTFGWSGFFSRYHRELEGKNFYNAIINELDFLKKLNIFPKKIRIVGFSHGGNVSLNMAKYVSAQNPPFIIDRLMLIGTPIQRETDYLILHPVFKEVYNFYSEGDIAQVADFLTTQYGRSSRVFQPRGCFELPSKLIQVQLRITKVLKNSKGRIIRVSKLDPNHLELWTFGWIQRIYRGRFPLNPLPMATLLPTIINNINSIDEKLSNHLSANIILKSGSLIVQDKKSKKEFNTCLSNAYIDKLRNCALEFKYNFPYAQHVRLIKDALNYAESELSKLNYEGCKKSLKFGKKRGLKWKH